MERCLPALPTSWSDALQRNEPSLLGLEMLPTTTRTSAVNQFFMWSNEGPATQARTPLMLAVFFGATLVAERLLENGADVNLQSPFDGKTALHICAAQKGPQNAEITIILLKSGASLALEDFAGQKATDIVARIKKEVGYVPYNFHPALQYSPLLVPHLSPLSTTQALGGRPLPPPSPFAEDAKLTTDEFRMYSFKVSFLAYHSSAANHLKHPSLTHSLTHANPSSHPHQCQQIEACPNLGEIHDWNECPYLHPSEKARRRDPRVWPYQALPCPEFRKGMCNRGDNCPFAHGVFECWLHPSRYRTTLCKEGAGCSRPICFFAHSVAQLREPSPPPFSSPQSINTITSGITSATGVKDHGAASTYSVGGTPNSPGSTLIPPASLYAPSLYGLTNNDLASASAAPTAPTGTAAAGYPLTSRCGSPASSSTAMDATHTHSNNNAVIAASAATATAVRGSNGSLSLPISTTSSPLLQSGDLSAMAGLESEEAAAVAAAVQLRAQQQQAAAAVQLRAQQQQAAAAAQAQAVLNRLLQTASTGGLASLSLSTSLSLDPINGTASISIPPTSSSSTTATPFAHNTHTVANIGTTNAASISPMAMASSSGGGIGTHFLHHQYQHQHQYHYNNNNNDALFHSAPLPASSSSSSQHRKKDHLPLAGGGVGGAGHGKGDVECGDNDALMALMAGLGLM